jgi:hypothetical protein
MTAAENVLAWLLIEKIGVPDDEPITPKRAQETIVNVIDHLREYETAALRRSGGLKPVERIEMVNYETGFQTPADPIWRVEVSGYCADFETETAANNFHAAIAALHPSDSPALEAGAAVTNAHPIAWRWKPRGAPPYRYEYGAEKPTGPSVHLFDVQPLFAALAIPATEDGK